MSREREGGKDSVSVLIVSNLPREKVVKACLNAAQPILDANGEGTARVEDALTGEVLGQTWAIPKESRPVSCGWTRKFGEGWERAFGSREPAHD